MLTMRSSSAAKMVKPPPPVPPRPSKTIVAEAFAKRRRNQEDTNTVPVRSAPPPPADLSRSESNCSINFLLRKPPQSIYERSISDELKSGSRTIIFQSSNMKSVSNGVLVRKDSMDNKVTVNKKNLCEVKNNNVSVTAKNTLNSVKITHLEKENTPRKITPEQSDEVTVNFDNVVTCVVPNKEEPNTTIQNGFNNTTEEVLVTPNSPDNIDDLKASDDKWEEMLKDKNHVNMLIDEMFASVLEETNTTTHTDTTTITINGHENNLESNSSTVLIIENNDVNYTTQKIKGSVENLAKSNSSTMEKKSVQFDDKKNAELLIEELESMRMEQERILKRQRKRSQEIYDNANGEECDNDEGMKNCHINIVNLNGMEKGTALDYERLKTMSSLHGLPPLPKSLSGFNLTESYSNPPTPVRTTSSRSNQPASFGSGHLVYPSHKGVNGAPDFSVQGRKPTNLDAQLAVLRREMYSLRQLDLSLLSQLWSLNESIQDFRQILQEQEECRVLSPPSPSPAPSSCDEGDGEEQYYVNASLLAPTMKFRPAPPPPPAARRSSNSSNASTGG